MQDELEQLDSSEHATDLNELRFYAFEQQLRQQSGGVVDPELAQKALHHVQKQQQLHASAQPVMAPQLLATQKTEETIVDRGIRLIGPLALVAADEGDMAWVPIALEMESAVHELELVEGSKLPTLYESMDRICATCNAPLHMVNAQRAACSICKSSFEQPLVMPSHRVFTVEEDETVQQRQRAAKNVADPETVEFLRRMACMGDAVPNELMYATMLLCHYMGARTLQHITLPLVGFVLGVLRRTSKEIIQSRNQVFCRLKGFYPPRMSREMDDLVRKYLFTTNIVWDSFYQARAEAEGKAKASDPPLRGHAAISRKAMEFMPEQYRDVYADSLRIPRHRAPSLEYRLFQILRLLGEERFSGYLILPHKMEVLEACDDVWRKLFCRELDWEFVPTVVKFQDFAVKEMGMSASELRSIVCPGGRVVVPPAYTLLTTLDELRPLQQKLHKMVKYDMDSEFGLAGGQGAGNTSATSHKMRRKRIAECAGKLARMLPVGIYNDSVGETGRYELPIRRWIQLMNLDRVRLERVRRVVRHEKVSWTMVPLTDRTMLLEERRLRWKSMVAMKMSKREVSIKTASHVCARASTKRKMGDEREDALAASLGAGAEAEVTGDVGAENVSVEHVNTEQANYNPTTSNDP